MAYGAILGQRRGLYPQIVVTLSPAESNVQVTATYNGSTVSALSVNGVAVLNVYSYGTWVVGAEDKTQNVVVDTVKQYSVSITLTRNIPISDVAVGTLVKLNESGSPINYIVVHQGLPDSMYDASCNGTWILRQDIARNEVWSATNTNTIANSSIQSYLNNDWINQYDVNIRNAIKQVKIPYCPGMGSSQINSGANGLSCKLFLLGCKELGFTQSDNAYLPNDGVKLAYFELGTGSNAIKKRVAKLNGVNSYWYPRSSVTIDAVNVYYIDTTGALQITAAMQNYGLRPAMILSNNLAIDPDNNIIVP